MAEKTCTSAAFHAINDNHCCYLLKAVAKIPWCCYSYSTSSVVPHGTVPTSVLYKVKFGIFLNFYIGHYYVWEGESARLPDD